MYNSRKSHDRINKTSLAKPPEKTKRIELIKNLDDLGFNTPTGFFILTIAIFAIGILIATTYLVYINHLDLLGQIIKDQTLIQTIALTSIFILATISAFTGFIPQSLVSTQEFKKWPFHKNRIAYSLTASLALPGFFVFQSYLSEYIYFFKSNELIAIEIICSLLLAVYILQPMENKTQFSENANKFKNNTFYRSIGDLLFKLFVIGLFGIYSISILYTLYNNAAMHKPFHKDIYLALVFLWYIIYISPNGKIFIEKSKGNFSISHTKIVIASLLITIVPILILTHGAILRPAFMIVGMASGISKSSWYNVDMESIKKEGMHKVSGSSILFGQQSYSSRLINGHQQIKAYMDIKHDKIIVLCPDWLNGQSRELMPCPIFKVDHVNLYQE